MVTPTSVQQQNVHSKSRSKSNKTAKVHHSSNANMPSSANMPTPAQAMGQPLINQTPHIAPSYVSILHKFFILHKSVSSCWLC